MKLGICGMVDSIAPLRLYYAYYYQYYAYSGAGRRTWEGFSLK